MLMATLRSGYRDRNKHNETSSTLKVILQKFEMTGDNNIYTMPNGAFVKAKK